MAPGATPLPWESKVDARLSALVARAQRDPQAAGTIANVFVRFTGDAASLRALGVKVRAVAGDIATASIALSDVPRVASMAEIMFIELSRPLGPDVPPPAEAVPP